MHKASCQCGQLSIASDQDPDPVLICNCRECQKRGGSAFASAAFFPRDSARIDGAFKTWTRPTASGKTLTNHFCPDCGTNLFWAAEIRPGHFGVAVGCFDTPHPTPKVAIWTSEQHEWLSFPDHWQEFTHAPPRPPAP